MLNRIIRLIIKEFLAILKDPKSRIILVVPPLIQLLVFSFAATHEVKNVGLGIYTEDNGRAARELVSRFYAIPRTFSRLQDLHDLAGVQRAIDAQEVLAVVHIGPTFSKDLEAGRSAPVQVILDGRKANAALVVQGYINSIVQTFAAEWSTNNAPPRTGTQGTEASHLVPRMWFNPNLNPIWSAVPALVGILINLVALLVTALSVARERELGTYEQLLVSPLRPTEILLGKAVPAIILGFIEGVLMVALLLLIFRIPFTGSLLLLLLAMFLFLVAIVGVGLFISSLSKTQQQGFLGAFTYMVPAVLLSGFATPVANIPLWLRWLAYLNPLHYMISLTRAIFLENPDAAGVMHMIWPLLPIGLITLTGATWMFRKRME
ncbi:MAG: ABC transporter permease [Desulfoplanes sp.]